MATERIHPSTEESQQNKISVLASADFKKRVEHAAKSLNLSVGAYVRQILEQHIPKTQ